MTQARSIGFGLLGFLSLAFFAGCSGSPSAKVTEPEQEAESPQQAAPESVQATATAAPTVRTAKPQRSLVYQKGGKKWIGDVPYDVWYDDPLAIASTTGAVAPAQPSQVAGATNPAAAPMSDPMPMPAAKSGGIDWKRVIPGDLLDAEVTTIRNRFNTNLQTVGSYNSSYLELPPQAVTLAVLSHVAQKHPDDIRWKENAKYIKHLAGLMNAEKLRSGPTSQRPLKTKFDNIVEILSGSVPATLEAPPDGESIQDVAKVPLIMKRLENADKIISINGGTAEAMKENAAQLKQEAAVVGALTQVLLDGYENFQDDEDFAGLVKNMVDATVDMREHIQNDQFDKFELDVSKMKQACTQCHSTYR